MKRIGPPIFMGVFVLIAIFLREFIVEGFSNSGIVPYRTALAVRLTTNIILVGVALYAIRKYKLSDTLGLHKFNIPHWGLYVFPLLYLPLLNLLFGGELPEQIAIWDIGLLLIYCLSIGFSEELCFRGFIQTFLVQEFGKTRKRTFLIIVWSALFFGVLHLLKFDKGWYGELSQLFFATFIGMLFGVLVWLTKRIYPVIFIHALIDFCAKLDQIGMPIDTAIRNATTLENAVFLTLISLPYLMYALWLFKKYAKPRFV